MKNTNKIKSRSHSKGEWVVSINNSVICNNGSTNDIIAQCNDLHLPSIQREANAKLIAAAPDMLEALEEVRELMADEGAITKRSSKIYENIKAAIKKAKGL